MTTYQWKLKRYEQCAYKTKHVSGRAWCKLTGRVHGRGWSHGQLTTPSSCICCRSLQSQVNCRNLWPFLDFEPLLLTHQEPLCVYSVFLCVYSMCVRERDTCMWCEVLNVCVMMCDCVVCVCVMCVCDVRCYVCDVCTWCVCVCASYFYCKLKLLGNYCWIGDCGFLDLYFILLFLLDNCWQVIDGRSVWPE